ncbi:MAG: DUF192 domain-containing protein [Chloroflexota bacterium]
MKVRLLVALLVLLLLPRSIQADATASPSSVLPAHARITASVSLGKSGDVALAYVSDGPQLAVTKSKGAGYILLWTHSLLAATHTLVFRHGSILGVGFNAGTSRHYAFAFSVHGTSVKSAIAGDHSGIVAAGEEAKLNSRGFVLRTQDLAQVGSVLYSIQTTYRRHSGLYRIFSSTRLPDYAPGQAPQPSATVRTAQGDVILLRLEVADTEAERETGLMNRKTLDPDSGMIFAWPTTVLDSFYMKDTYVALTVGFLAPDGTLQETQDMAPLTQDLHTPAAAYQYAIEVNQGWFAANGINTGDKFTLNLPPEETPSPYHSSAGQR